MIRVEIEISDPLANDLIALAGAMDREEERTAECIWAAIQHEWGHHAFIVASSLKEKRGVSS